MSPPPAEPFTSRILLGPALRAQPDRRLVKLVREGYEAAFEEIVRRYRRPLDHFAAAIVGNRSEDVTQDAFSKALLALRGSEQEIELRPWLYRIVRNTALNDLRDRPPVAAELGEAIAAERGVDVEVERREEMANLIERLRALPEPQRAAIVMRELEGLSHEEIAAALGVSGGAARQAIHRARTSLRNGLGFLIPLPLLRFLFEHGVETAAGTAGAAAGVASTAGAGATLGGLGAGGALKVGVATAVLAGSVGAGVAVQHENGGDGITRPATTAAATLAGSDEALSGELGGSSGPGGSGSGDDEGSEGEKRNEDNSGSEAHGRHRGRGGDEDDGFGRGGERSGRGDSSGHGGRSLRNDDRADQDLEDRSGSGSSSGRHSSLSGSGHGDDDGGGSGSGQSGEDDDGDDGSNSGSGSGGSGSGGSSGSSGPGSGGEVIAPVSVEPTESEEESGSSSGSGENSGSGSGEDND